ncbi:MAG: flagellar motor protein MotB [FCB group bacterium]|nr:flagellar motor protein MotB [FCB group bacterium]
MDEIEDLLIAANDGDDEEEEAAGWLMTYGDLMTLLLCFFVLLFSMSETKQDEFFQLMQSMRAALGQDVVPEAGTREGLTMINKEEEKQPIAVDELGGMIQAELDSIKKEAEEFILTNSLEGDVSVKVEKRGAVITVSDMLLFPPAKAEFNKEGEELLGKIAEMLKQFDYHIQVEGHTDSVPISGKQFKSNWELSANRACEIVRYLISKGIPPEKLSAEGFAEFRPVADNSTPEGRAKNRRVEIVYKRTKIEDTIYEQLEKRNSEPVQAVQDTIF